MFGFVLVLILLAVIAKFLHVYWFQNYSHFGISINKIPGPPAYPIIGNQVDFYSLTPEQIFQRISDDIQKYGVINRKWFLSHVAVYLTHPKDVELVLGNTTHIDKSSVYNYLHLWLETGLLTSKGQKWQKRRKILTPSFHFGILQEFVPIFNNEATKLVANLRKLVEKNRCVEILNPISRYTLLSIAETSMGVKLDSSPRECENYIQALYNFGKLFIYRIMKPWLLNNNLFFLTETGKMAQATVNTLHSFSKKVIFERKAHFSSNLQKTKKKCSMLDLLLQDNEIDDVGIREEVDTFMFEGHDTTALALQHTLLCLANHPSIQQEVYEEMLDILGKELHPPNFAELKNLALMERCIKESLRLFPSVPYIGRKAAQDIKTTTGYTIPAGSMIHMYIYHIHRNQDFYPNPEIFNPDRFLPENTKTRHPYAYLPFSAGPRNCIGQRYAMMELKAAVCEILKEFILEPIDQLGDLVFVSDIVLRSKNKIKVLFKPRNVYKR